MVAALAKPSKQLRSRGSLTPSAKSRDLLFSRLYLLLDQA
jgi:hypothetical protein